MARQLEKLLDGDIRTRLALTELQKMTRDDSDVRHARPWA